MEAVTATLTTLMVHPSTTILPRMEQEFRLLCPLTNQIVFAILLIFDNGNTQISLILKTAFFKIMMYPVNIALEAQSPCKMVTLLFKDLNLITTRRHSLLVQFIWR